MFQTQTARLCFEANTKLGTLVATMRMMKRLAAAILVTPMLLIAPLARSSQVVADTTSSPSLVVAQLKITSSNGQFITLYNASNAALDMSKYQLEYFNNYDLSKATSSRLINLDGTLAPHAYYMVNDGSLLLCYQLTVESVSLGFSSTAGMVEVLANAQTGAGLPAIPSLQDYVSWSKSTVGGVQTLPANTAAFLQRLPQDGAHNPNIISAGGGTWQGVQPDATNNCNLVTVGAAPSVLQTGIAQLLPANEPAATIVTLDTSSTDSSQAAPRMPAGDIGLMTPSITELLPNPVGSGNDATDEFIELYNPNDSDFDLSGFALQTGLTTTHNYIFPVATMLPAHTFVSFYSKTTGISLSNTSGRAALLDPYGNNINTSAPYTNAKDGQSWALANGTWYWTTKPTPNAANIINQPSSAKKGSTAANSKKSKSAAAVKATAAKKVKLAASSKQTSKPDAAATTPIHARTLALVVGLALLYGAYEYRTDISNRLYRFRRHLGFGR